MYKKYESFGSHGLIFAFVWSSNKACFNNFMFLHSVVVLHMSYRLCRHNLCVVLVILSEKKERRGSLEGRTKTMRTQPVRKYENRIT